VKTGIKEKAEHVILKDVYNHCILCEVERWGSGSRAGVESNGHTGNRIEGKEIIITRTALFKFLKATGLMGRI